MEEFATICARLKSRLSHTIEPMTDKDGIRQAAVNFVLRENAGQAEVLIIKRATAIRDHWSGHLALPGGRWQPEDENLSVTALRETCEEVGIDLRAGGEMLGRLGTITTRSPLVPRIAVTSFVAVAPAAYDITTDVAVEKALQLNHEVADAFWVSLTALKNSRISDGFRIVIGGEERVFPAYPTAQGLIWGMTENMMTSFLALIDR